MILEDSPDNEYDLHHIIGDFFSDKIKYTPDESAVICKNLFIENG